MQPTGLSRAGSTEDERERRDSTKLDASAPQAPQHAHHDEREGQLQGNLNSEGIKWGMGWVVVVENEKSAQRGSFWDGYPADIRVSFTRISRPKTSVRALKILGKQAFGRGYP